MHDQMLLRIAKSKNEIRRAIISHFREVSNRIPNWVNDYTPQNSLGFGTKGKVRKIVDEIVDHISKKVKEDFKLWNDEILVPLIEEKAEYIYESTDKDLKGIFDSIDTINSQLSGKDIELSSASGWERAAGVAALCLGSASGAYMLVGGFDVKGIIKTIAIDISVGTGLFLLSVTNPVLAIGAAVAVLWNAVRSGASNATQKIKTKVAQMLCDSINNNVQDKADVIVENVEVELTKIADTAVSSVDIKLDTLKAETEAIIKELQMGQQYADKRNAVINKCEEKLKVICEKLDTLVFELAGLSSTAN